MDTKYNSLVLVNIIHVTVNDRQGDDSVAFHAYLISVSNYGITGSFGVKKRR